MGILGSGGATSQLITCSQMRQFEASVIASGETTGAELMERAGSAVVAAIERRWPELFPPAEPGGGQAVVLCGPGKNGGDGYVVARLLHERGWSLDVIGLGDQASLPQDAAAARQRFLDAGGEVDDCRDPEGEFPGYMVSTFYDVLIDAIVGAGGRCPLPPGWRRTRDAFAEDSERLVAIDCFSGLDLDTGQGEGGDGADLTVTFHRGRPGHVLGRGPSLSGTVMVADLGLNNAWNHSNGIGWRFQRKAALVFGPDMALGGRALAKPVGRHKYDHGHVLVLSGPPERAGAARLAARAALRVGAGLVTLGVPLPEDLAGGGPDALMRRVIDGPDALTAALEDERINAVCIGPGLGIERARAMTLAALRHPRGRRRPSLVLDADALTAFAGDARTLFDLMGPWPVVMTPHAGEFQRLFQSADRPGSRTSLIDTVRDAAREAGATILHKGPTSVIADDAGSPPTLVAALDVPWLATAGTGDVLAGIVAGLLARGLAPADAAATGALLHAAAARRFGPGLIADDLPDQLPGVFRDLGL